MGFEDGDVVRLRMKFGTETVLSVSRPGLAGATAEQQLVSSIILVVPQELGMSVDLMAALGR